jgi:hypothetical protein
VTNHNNSEAALERIRCLSEQLARRPVNRGRRREFVNAIRLEAARYRKTLDIAQANRRALKTDGPVSRLLVQ